MSGQLQIVPDEPCPHGCEEGFIWDTPNTGRPCPLHGKGLPKIDPTTESGQSLMAPLFSWRGAICSPESDLPPSTRLVALVLSLHMNEKGGSAFPSLQTLAEESGLSRRQVIRHLQDLTADKWLRATKKDRKPTIYSARFPRGFGGVDK